MEDTKKDQRIMDLLNELITLLPGFVPLEGEQQLKDTPLRIALARAYADDGFRKYIQRAIRIETEGTINVADMRGLWVQKGRIEVLKELYRTAREMFNEAQKLDKSLSNITT